MVKLSQFGKSYSIVIPIYNEAESLPILVPEILEVIDGKADYEIIFVDDGSNDLPDSKLNALIPDNKNIYVVRMKKNYRQGTALQVGFDLAVKDITVSLDGDLQHNFNDMPFLVKELIENDYDVVCGWRYERKDELSKRLTSKIANLIRKMLFREKIHDVGCTFRAYKTSVVKRLYLEGYLHRFLTAVILKQGCRIGEIKVSHRERRFGKSKYDNISRFFSSLKPVFLLLCTNMARRSNIHNNRPRAIYEIWKKDKSRRYFI